ncbi:N-acetylmuramoyl-L-alanine amidase [Streptomyces halstedii]|uniref:peptidoglycan recognition protein family protein n=1 Tax=Streptomyces halstedii TaxID=1944 RepID=UPI003815873A
MATPLTADRLLKALRDEGVAVVEVGNWRTHNRVGHGAWGPVHGSLVHHTVTKGTANTVAMVRDGYTALPGPLCHGMIAKDGRVHLVGWGRTNHAGGGDPRVLDQVVAEDYGTRPTPPTRGNSNGVDGNARFYGWECENLGDGKDPWPAAQYDAIVRVQAAVCRAHGWSAKSAIGHLEWSSDKIDPRGFGMPALRADVAERLTHPAGWSPDDKTDPQSEEDTMTPAQEALLKKLAADVAELKKNAAVAPWTYRNAKLDAESRAAGNRIPDMHGRIEQLQTTLDAVAAAVAELKGA